MKKILVLDHCTGCNNCYQIIHDGTRCELSEPLRDKIHSMPDMARGEGWVPGRELPMCLQDKIWRAAQKCTVGAIVIFE